MKGTDIYKEWARKQWWCAKTLWEPVLNLTHQMEEIEEMANQQT